MYIPHSIKADGENLQQMKCIYIKFYEQHFDETIVGYVGEGIREKFSR